MARSQECLKISYWNFNVQEVEIGKRMISEAYDLLGICHQFIEIPPSRSVETLKNNDVQAHLWRTTEFITSHQDWVNYLPEPILTTSISIFYDQKQFANFDLNSSLKGRTIGTALGSTQGEKFVAELGAKTISVSNYDRLYQILMSKRVSSAIMPSELFNAYKLKLGSNSDVKEASLYKTNIYHVIAESHKHLIPKLNEALLAVKKKAGFFERLQAVHSN